MLPKTSQDVPKTMQGWWKAVANENMWESCVLVQLNSIDISLHWIYLQWKIMFPCALEECTVLEIIGNPHFEHDLLLIYKWEMKWYHIKWVTPPAPFTIMVKTCQKLNIKLHSLKLTWHLKMDGWKTSFLLGWPPGRCYVSFRECTWNDHRHHQHLQPSHLHPSILSGQGFLPSSLQQSVLSCFRLTVPQHTRFKQWTSRILRILWQWFKYFQFECFVNMSGSIFMFIFCSFHVSQTSGITSNSMIPWPWIHPEPNCEQMWTGNNDVM